MKKMSTISSVGIFVMLLTAGCEDQFLTKNSPESLGKTSTVIRHEGPGSYADHPNGDRYVYPQITFQEFIPKDDLYDWKTWAWRITWPGYDAGYDPNKIPTVFSLNGALNSFEYLNNVDPQNTYNTVFSLYDDDKIIRSANLGDKLDYIDSAPKGTLKTVCFEYDDEGIPVDFIQWMVEQAPGGFQTNLWEPGALHEWEYNQGDFLIFQVETSMAPTRWGGIRVVSMDPRIIEVYLALPEN